MKVNIEIECTPVEARQFLKLLQAKDVQDLVKLQTEFVQAQMHAMTEQAKDLSETTTKAMMDSAKIPTTGGLSS